MKKLLAILLALTVIGGVAFAQVTFSGYERLTATSTNTGLAMANRVRFNFDVKDADGNFGAWGRYQFANTDAPVVAYAYGWVKLGKMVKVTGGILGNYDYDLSSGSASEYAATGNVSNDGVALDATKGALIQFMPVDALNLGLTVVPVAGNIGLGAFGVNAKYDITDVGSIVVSSLLADKLENSAASFSFSFTGVENLTASAGYKYGEGIGYKSLVAKNNGVYAIVDYAMDALSLQVAGEYDITAKNLYAEGFVDYAIGAFTLRGLGGYDQNGSNLGNQVYVGAEGLYKVGKGTLTQTFYYGDVTGWKAITAVKVAF